MKFWKLIFFTLSLILGILIITIFQLPDQNLHIVACDVGQGDAILTTYKNIQILTDGGPNARVLDCLSEHMPFWDKELELVILTHPQKDHFMGLTEIFKRYEVKNFLFNDVDAGTPEYQLLENARGGSGVKVVQPSNGLVLRLGLIYLEVVNPLDEAQDSLPGLKPANPNSLSIIYVLKYAQFKGIFTGDMTPEISGLLAQNWTMGEVDYIKVPHHGSKNGITESFLKILDPKVGVISAGRNNIYGHPNREILEMLEKYGTKIYRTDEVGDVEVVSNGEKLWVEN